MLGGWNDVRNDYIASRNNRFRRRLTGVQALGSGGDYHYRNEQQFLYMIELARFFDRNDPIVGQAITRLVDNVVQDGFILDPQTGDAEVDAHILEKHNEWASDPEQCDAAGEHNLHQKARLTLRSVVVDGDIFHLPLRNGRIDSIEAHRVRSPKKTRRNVVHGVLLDKNRKRLEYWFTANDISPMAPAPLFRDIKPYRARDKAGHRQVFQVYDPKRVSQTRGVTALAPIADMVGIHDDLQITQLVKAQTAACFAIIEEIELGNPSVTSPLLGPRQDVTRSDGTTQTNEELFPGMRITAPPGVKLTGFSPNIPNPSFFEHVSTVLGIISVNLGLPLAVLMLDPTKTNFSGWRGAMDQARIGFRRIQKRILADQFYTPIAQWRIRRLLATDEKFQVLVAKAERKLGERFNVMRHTFNLPTWRYIEPKKDSDADINRQKHMLISPRRLLAEKGLDYETIVTETIDDRTLLITAAMKATEKIKSDFTTTADDLDWRELGTGLQLPPGIIDKEPGQKSEQGAGKREQGKGKREEGGAGPKNLHDEREAATKGAVSTVQLEPDGTQRIEYHEPTAPAAGKNGEGVSC